MGNAGLNSGEILPDPLFELLRPERLTSVVDIGANPMYEAPPYKPMVKAGICTVTGFEPQPLPLFELNRLKGPREQYLPYAIGDGTERTLHVCKSRGMTSLLAPDPDHLAIFNEFSKMGEVEQEIRISTRRLDDIDEIQDVDFLKIDIQGAELDVFRAGRKKLARTVAIQTEVSFVPLYKDQPAFGTVDLALREMGFIPHRLAELKRWTIAPMVFSGNQRIAGNQLLEADLVYVRDFSQPENLDGEQWKHLALIAHHCYGSVDLALRAIFAAMQIGAISRNVPARYIEILRNYVPDGAPAGAQPGEDLPR
jgi:FkbM family methyltransferase